MFTENTSLIIPTKNRSEKLIKLLYKLATLKLKFNEIIIIDSSNIIHSKIIENKCKLNNYKYYHTKSSTSYQRNFGLKKVKNNTYVMFMDDDVVLFDDAFSKMDKCVKKYRNNEKIVGFGFNQIDVSSKNNFLEFLKKNKFIQSLGIYPSTPGKIAKSGWHSKILNLQKNYLADWVYTTMSVFKFKTIKNAKFDETFGKYSYLEDLDFSLNLTKNKKKILLCSKARFKHPNNLDRSSFEFGVTEIINRYKIIKKYKLSKKLFYITSLLRFILSISRSFLLNKKYFSRSMGNVYGFFLLK